MAASRARTAGTRWRAGKDGRCTAARDQPRIGPRSAGNGARGEDESGSDEEAQQDSECACTPRGHIEGTERQLGVGMVVVAMRVAVIIRLVMGEGPGVARDVVGVWIGRDVLPP